MLLPAVIRTPVSGGLAGLIAYFGAIGLAYLAAEIAMIKHEPEWKVRTSKAFQASGPAGHLSMADDRTAGR
jgi:hypothetical protein